MPDSIHPVTQDRLKELLHYDPETGAFTWREATATHRVVGSAAGSLDNRGYWRIRLFGKAYAAHRLAWLYVHGIWPAEDIDHINRVRTDNRIANLRDVSRAINMQNVAPKVRASLPGVRLHRFGRFEARIGVRGVTRTIGYFDTAEEAHAAYVAEKREAHPGTV